MPKISVVVGDALTLACDVLVLKYAQARYGVDQVAADALMQSRIDGAMSPAPGSVSIVESQGALGARTVMFVGTESLRDLDYRDIRTFARRAIVELAEREIEVRRLAITTHGAGFGLDEKEAFESLIAGLLDAIESDSLPAMLHEIAVVERDQGRAGRLAAHLEEILPPEERPSRYTDERGWGAADRMRDVGYVSDSKPLIFVAMPFNEAKSDHYHYGIQGAVNAAGCLCVRIDSEVFTGDVLAQIKRKISAAMLVIADLSGANPNVYLEVGYAWGLGVPTLLISDAIDELRFDTQGQRCLSYTGIRDLEVKLSKELRTLIPALLARGHQTGAQA